VNNGNLWRRWMHDIAFMGTHLDADSTDQVTRARVLITLAAPVRPSPLCSTARPDTASRPFWGSQPLSGGWALTGGA